MPGIDVCGAGRVSGRRRAEPLLQVSRHARPPVKPIVSSNHLSETTVREVQVDLIYRVARTEFWFV